MTDTTVRHAFLSYVHENDGAVDELEEALDAAGINVWRDTNDLWPGEDWRAKIRSAIRDGSLAFIACVSSASVQRTKTYQNEELTLAVEELRQRQPGAQWLFPVRLDECEIPAFELGAGKTLRDIQYTDLFGPKKHVNLIRLTTSVSRLLEPATSPAQVAALLAADASKAEDNIEDVVKALLRDPNGDIQLEERIDDVAQRALDQLVDPNLFPSDPSVLGDTNASAARYADAALTRYEQVLAPLTRCFVLGGTYSKPMHAHIWTRAMDAIASTYTSAGSKLLVGLRHYPLAWLMQAMAVASVERSNYEPLRSVAIDAEVNSFNTSGPPIGFVSVRTPFDSGLEWVGSAIAFHEAEGREIDEEFVAALQRRSHGRRHTPVSDVVHARLRPYFARLIRPDEKYDEIFDRASIILDALAIDVRLRRRQGEPSPPAWPGFGRYTWRNSQQYFVTSLEESMSQDLGLRSNLARAGLFGGEEGRCEAAFAQLAELAAKVRHEQQFSF